MYGFALWQCSWEDIHADGAGVQQNYIGFYLDDLPQTLPVGTSNAVIAYDCMAQGVSNCGFRLLNPNGSKFVNCEAENGSYGWLIGNTASGMYPIEFPHFVNCLADTCSGYGWVVQEGSNAAAGTYMHFANCWSGNCGTGVYMDGCTNLNLSNWQIAGNAGSGLVLNNSTNNVISEIGRAHV